MGVHMGTAEMAEKCIFSQTTVSKWYREGNIPKAEQDKKGSPWRIPTDAEKPER